MAYGLQDVVNNRRQIDESPAGDDFKRTSRAKLDAMVALAEADDCRRVHLLRYFGETSQACGNCDNCLSPPQRWDATEATRKLLSCIYRIRQSGSAYGAHHVIGVLRGEREEKILQRGHDQLSTFGIGAELDARTWHALLRQIVARGWVEVAHDRFGVLELTDAARPVLRGEQTVMLSRAVRDAAPVRGKRARTGGASGGAARAAASALGLDDDARTRFDRLKSWRSDAARTQGVPPYVIFHDAHLAEIARADPVDLDDLRQVHGVGAAKLQRYGESVLRALNDEI
jgi:ATP-dependent DNA helicase RecQ